MIIYVEPEDDITDVISKVKSTSADELQISPMRGSIALRSLINLRILARTAKEADKILIIATTDSTTLRLAASAGLATTDQSTNEPAETEATQTETTDSKSAKSSSKSASEPAKKSADKEKAEEEFINDSFEKEENTIISSELEEESDEKAKKDKRKSLIPNFDRFRKWIIIGAVSLVLLIGFLVWAIVFAPAADISLSIKTTKKSFSDYFTGSITFTTKEDEEDLEKAKFLLEKHTENDKKSVNFTATGERDDGTKAGGDLTLSYTSSIESSVTVAAGTTFMHGGLNYVTNDSVTLATNSSVCGFGPCTVKADVKVTASEKGEMFNTNASSDGSGWYTSAAVEVFAATAMTNGTTKLVTIVTSDDIRKAQAELDKDSATCNIKELEQTFPQNLFMIRDAQTIVKKDAISTPALNEVVSGNTKPKLEVEATCTLYGVERSKVANFIEKKVSEAIKDEAGRKVFSTGIDDAFMVKKSANESGSPITARLETTSIEIGPDITEEKVLEKALGERVGTVNSWLRSQPGIDQNSVRINTSFFWVSTIPNDPNKVKVTINSTEEE